MYVPENQINEQKKRKEEEKRKWKEEDEAFMRPANQWADKTSSVSGTAMSRPPQMHTAALESVRSDGSDERRWIPQGPSGIESNLLSQHQDLQMHEIVGGDLPKEMPRYEQLNLFIIFF